MIKDEQIIELQKRIQKLEEEKIKPKNVLEKLGESKDIMGFAEIVALFGTIKLMHSVGDQ